MTSSATMGGEGLESIYKIYHYTSYLDILTNLNHLSVVYMYPFYSGITPVLGQRTPPILESSRHTIAIDNEKNSYVRPSAHCDKYHTTVQCCLVVFYLADQHVQDGGFEREGVIRDIGFLREHDRLRRFGVGRQQAPVHEPAVSEVGVVALLRRQLQHALNHVLRSTTHHNKTQHSPTQHSTAQHGPTQHNKAQHSTAQHDMTRHSTLRSKLRYTEHYISRAL